ncbi:unnamed protein product, partial [marine sediment metagenome]
FFRNGVITDIAWHDEMVGLGYPDRYITMYKASEEVTRKEKDIIAREREERDHTRADFVAGYVAGIFTASVTKEKLIAMGYSINEADFYITLADYKMAKAVEKKESA